MSPRNEATQEHTVRGNVVTTRMSGQLSDEADAILLLSTVNGELIAYNAHEEHMKLITMAETHAYWEYESTDIFYVKTRRLYVWIKREWQENRPKSPCYYEERRQRAEDDFNRMRLERMERQREQRRRRDEEFERAMRARRNEH